MNYSNLMKMSLLSLSLIKQMESLLYSILLRFDIKFIHCIEKERETEAEIS